MPEPINYAEMVSVALTGTKSEQKKYAKKHGLQWPVRASKNPIFSGGLGKYDGISLRKGAMP